MPPKEKYFPVSDKEVTEWLDRVDHISSTVHAYMTMDPKEEEERERKRARLREEQRREEDRKRLEMVAQRYSPQYFERFSDDKMIDALLQQADAPPAPTVQRLDDLTDFEKLCLEEAEKAKKEGNTAVGNGNYAEALRKYDNALGMKIQQDLQLQEALHNNRAMVCMKLGQWMDCVESASFVLQCNKWNVKALMRRATGLMRLHRPHEAVIDLESALKAESKNPEVKALLPEARRQCVEIDFMNDVYKKDPALIKDLETRLREAEKNWGKLLDLTTPKEVSEGKTIVGSDEDVGNAETALTESLVQLTSKVDEIGTRVFVRTHNGVVLGQTVIDQYFMASKLDTASKVVLLSAVYRFMAHACDTAINTEAYYDNKEVASGIVVHAVKTVKFSPSVAAVCATAFLAVLASHSEHARKHIAEHLTPQDLTKLLVADRKEEVRVYHVLRLLDQLLKSESWVNKVPVESIVPFVFTALNGKNRALRDTAAALLMRFSSHAATCKTLLSDYDVLRKVSPLVDPEDLRDDNNLLYMEALLAILYNTILVADRRAAVSEVQGVGLLGRCVTVVKNSELRKDRLNVVARALGLMAKCAPYSADLAADNHVVQLLTEVLFLSCDSIGETDYGGVCIEHAVTTLAALQRAEGVVVHTDIVQYLGEFGNGKAFDRLLELSSTDCDRTAGNVALLIGMLAAKYPTESRKKQTVKVLLDAIKLKRSKVHELEHAKGAGSEVDDSAVPFAKSATKNLAIALSRCAKDPEMLQELRDQNGIEILYAALEKKPGEGVGTV